MKSSQMQQLSQRQNHPGQQPDTSRNRRKRRQQDASTHEGSSSSSCSDNGTSLALIPLHPAACKLAPPQQRGSVAVASSGVSISGDNPNNAIVPGSPESGGLSLVLPTSGMKPLPLVLGRTNLANWWWKSCPCQHYCRLHCRPVAQNIKSLSKVMIQLDSKGRVRVAGKNPHLVTIVSPSGVATTLTSTDTNTVDAAAALDNDTSQDGNKVSSPIVLNMNDVISIGRRDREPWMRFQVIPYIKPNKRTRLQYQPASSRRSSSSGASALLMPMPTLPTQVRQSLSSQNEKLVDQQEEPGKQEKNVENEPFDRPRQRVDIEPSGSAAAAVAAAVAAKFNTYGTRNPPAVEEIDESPTNSSSSVNVPALMGGSAGQQNVTKKQRSRPRSNAGVTSSSKFAPPASGSSIDSRGRQGESDRARTQVGVATNTQARNLPRSFNNTSSGTNGSRRKPKQASIFHATGSSSQKKTKSSPFIKSSSERQKPKRRQQEPQEFTYGGPHPYVHLLYQKYKTSAAILVKTSKGGGAKRSSSNSVPEQLYDSDGNPIPTRKSFFLPAKPQKKERTKNEVDAMNAPPVPAAVSTINTSSLSAVANATTALVNAYAAFGNSNADKKQHDVSPALKSLFSLDMASKFRPREVIGSSEPGFVGDKLCRNEPIENLGNGDNQDDSFSGSSIISSSSPATQPNYSSNNNKPDEMHKNTAVSNHRLLEVGIPPRASTTGPYVVEIVLPPRNAGKDSDDKGVEPAPLENNVQEDQVKVASKLGQPQPEGKEETSPTSSEQQQCGQDERLFLRLEDRVHAEETKGNSSSKQSNDDGDTPPDLSQGDDESRQPIEESSSMLSMPHCSFGAGTACSSAAASTGGF